MHNDLKLIRVIKMEAMILKRVKKDLIPHPRELFEVSKESRMRRGELVLGSEDASPQYIGKCTGIEIEVVHSRPESLLKMSMDHQEDKDCIVEKMSGMQILSPQVITMMDSLHQMKYHWHNNKNC